MNTSDRNKARSVLLEQPPNPYKTRGVETQTQDQSVQVVVASSSETRT